MSFTTGNVTVEASGGTPVLVYEAPAGVPTDVNLYINGDAVWLLDIPTQVETSGYLFSSLNTSIAGLVGAIYAVSYSTTTPKVFYAASNII